MQSSTINILYFFIVIYQLTLSSTALVWDPVHARVSTLLYRSHFSVHLYRVTLACMSPTQQLLHNPTHKGTSVLFIKAYTLLLFLSRARGCLRSFTYSFIRLKLRSFVPSTPTCLSLQAPSRTHRNSSSYSRNEWPRSSPSSAAYLSS